MYSTAEKRLKNTILEGNKKSFWSVEHMIFELALFAHVNECENPDACGKGSECQNTAGTYQCICKSGFKNQIYKLSIM